MTGRSGDSLDARACPKAKDMWPYRSNDLPSRLRAGILAACLASATIAARADEPEAAAPIDDPAEEPARDPGRSPLDKTLGGRQFWADVEFFHKWRIQQNVLTGHFRLLDGDDYRHASGSREECRRKLEEIRRARKLAPMSGEAVILVHGIIRSSKSMEGMGRYLEEHGDGLEAFGFTYPSTRIGIAESAEYLQSVVESLEGVEKIHIVAHSMGGLVTRAWLAEHADPRIGRIVMIATPNQGADLADRFAANGLYRVLLGPAGQQMTRKTDGFAAGLPIPSAEFGIIAGGRGTPQGYNPLIPGDDDGTVSIESTRLPGAADFIVVDRIHSLLNSSDKVQDCVLRFLQQGRFRKDGAAQPIPRITISEPAAEPKRE